MRSTTFAFVILGSALAIGCASQGGSSEGVATEPASGSGGKAAGGRTDGSTGGAGGAGGSPAATSTGGTTGTASGGAPGSGGAPAASSGGMSGAADPVSSDAAAPTGDAAAPTTPPSAPSPGGAAPYGCTGCKKIFDGTTLNGWESNVEGAWVAKDGVLASTGKPNDIWTKEDYGDVRIFFQVRQEKGNHKPGTILFGTRPASGAAPKRGLGGAQFQPPNGASWNYGAGGTFTRHTNPNFNVNNWHQCEVLVKEAGSFKAACCPVGPTPCKGTLVLSWKGNGKKAPFGIQMHNAGLFDEYKEIWVEVGATGDELLSMK
jgi:Domain of Unknown Function (DUF1080)